MKILVTGANGQLGTDLVKALKDHEVMPLTHADADITDINAVKEVCSRCRPDVIVNTAAFVRVDDCETNPDLAFKVNALGARNMAVVAEGMGAKLVQISTDYVFGGEAGDKSEARISKSETNQNIEIINKNQETRDNDQANANNQDTNTKPQARSTKYEIPIAMRDAVERQESAQNSNDKNEESGTGDRTKPSVSPPGSSPGQAFEKGRRTPYTEFDTPVPLNVYGRSKLAGEDFARHLCRKYFIVRASGLFGVAGSSGKGGNFIETILRLARERDKLTVVNDQVFSPTYTPDLAAKIVQLMTTELYGIYHVTNRGACSWYDFAKEALRLAGSKTPILPITSAQYPQKAKRPSFSVLDHYNLKLLGLDDLPPWQEALSQYMNAKGHSSRSS